MLPACVIVLSALAATGAPQGVLLDFTADWCGPCQEMSPLVSRLQREGYPIRKVNVDKERELAQRFKVTGIPAFVLVVNGREVTRVVGRTSEATLKQLLAQIPAAAPAAADTQLADNAAPRRSTLEAPPPTRSSTPVTLTNDAPKSSGLKLPFFGKRDDRAPRVISEPAAPPVLRAKLSDQPLPPPTGASPARDPLSSSVRIRVNDSKGENFGSGTVIASQVGRSLILTCGHVFRSLDKTSKVEVDIFTGPQQQAETYVGKVLRYDLESDVGLIAINSDAPLPTCPVAPARFPVLKDTPVISVGCGGGDRPTVQEQRVTALNRYLGPDNLECTGVPVQGRSGGGLFTREGQVIGVCTAADPRDQRGLYAGLKAIQALLDDCQLSALYQGNGPAATSELASETQPAATAAPTQFASAPGSASRTASRTRPAAGRAPAGVDLGAAAELPGDTDAAAEEWNKVAALSGRPAAARAQGGAIDPEAAAFAAEARQFGHQADGDAADEDADAERLRRTLEQVGHAEVVCVVRPINQPQDATRVIVIHRASPRFVTYLAGELEAQESVQTTSGRRRNPAAAPGSADARAADLAATLDDVELPAVSVVSRHQPADRSVSSPARSTSRDVRPASPSRASSADDNPAPQPYRRARREASAALAP